LVVGVKTVPPGARLRIDVQRRNHEGRYRTVTARTVIGRFATLKIRRWDRLAVLFAKGGRRSDVVYIRRDGKVVSASPVKSARTQRGKT
jgi:hypothetical protein